MSRDVLRTLAAARPAELDPDAPVDPATRAAELARARTGHHRVTGAVPRRRIRPMWGLGLVGAATAALVAATTLTGTDSPTVVQPGTSSTPRALDARTVLLAAADQAEKQTDAVRAYWYQATVMRSYNRVTSPQGDYTIVSEQRDEGWTPSAPGGRRWNRQQFLGARPATKADQAAWQRAGSPSTFKVFFPAPKASGKGGGTARLKPAEFTAAPGKPQISSSPLTNGDEVFWLGRNVTMKDLRSLPADPARLKKSLLRWYEGHGTESTSEPMGSDEWLFQVVRGLVIDMPVTPEVRGAAFRMLAELKSVRSVGEATDAQGRTGTAIAMVTRTPNGVLQHRLIIDPVSGNALADEIVILKPAGANAHLPAGSPLVSTTVIKTTWTNTPPR